MVSKEKKKRTTEKSRLNEEYNISGFAYVPAWRLNSLRLFVCSSSHTQSGTPWRKRERDERRSETKLMTFPRALSVAARDSVVMHGTTAASWQAKIGGGEAWSGPCRPAFISATAAAEQQPMPL